MLGYAGGGLEHGDGPRWFPVKRLDCLRLSGRSFRKWGAFTAISL